MTAVPSIYHPHDLQHVHLPGFFTPAQRRWRTAIYGVLAHQARMVAVASTWTKRDVETHLNLEPAKVVVIPLAPPPAVEPEPTADEVAAVGTRYGLPARYLLYPAQTWPHKNHLGLLEAIAILRQRGVSVSLVASGQQNEFFPTLRRRTAELGLQEQVRWVGFVPPQDLAALYRRATALVVPSLFEAGSFPLWEAFRAGIPAACSNVTSLPAQAGDAALVFDAERPESIADAITRLWMEPQLCRKLVERGIRQVSQFTWERTARTFRAHYRRIAGRRLADEDVSLLAQPPRI